MNLPFKGVKCLGRCRIPSVQGDLIRENSKISNDLRVLKAQNQKKINPEFQRIKTSVKPTGMRNLRIAKLEIRVELELRNYRVEPKMESICDGTNPEKSLKPEKSEIIPKILRGSYKRILTILY